MRQQKSGLKKDLRNAGVLPPQAKMAEAVRFELTEDLRPRRFSRPVHSTALPRFHRLKFYQGIAQGRPGGPGRES